MKKYIYAFSFLVIVVALAVGIILIYKHSQPIPVNNVPQVNQSLPVDTPTDLFPTQPKDVKG